MNMGSSRISTSQRFAQPLVSEGQGSVFPVGLPLSKRRTLEVDIIKRFDRRVLSSTLTYDVLCGQLGTSGRDLSAVLCVEVLTTYVMRREGKASTGRHYQVGAFG